MIIHSYDANAREEEKALPFYAATVGESRPQRTIHRPAGINDYQLLYTESGIGKVRIKEQDFEVHEGDIFILPPFTPHEYGPISSVWNTLWITYNGRAAKSAFPFHSDIRRCEAFVSFYKKIKRRERTSEWRMKTSALLYELLLCINECEGLTPKKSEQTTRDISTAVQYIAEHYHETVELSKLASIAGLSEGHFCRVFKQYTHMRTVEYITNLRIERAKDLLLQADSTTIAEIAAQTGFQSAAYFSKTFKSKVGVTPEEYRSRGLSI